MTTLLLMTALYFLPTILAHNKRDFAGIFLVNFFFGWTVIGWVIAMIWACSAEIRPPHVMVVAGPGVAHYCTRCGTIGVVGGRFCGTCGRPI